jgi:hypothetical protein
MKQLELYKTWMKIFASYLDKAPASGYDSIFNKLVDRGSKAFPKDEKAMQILTDIATVDNPATALHKLVSYRFKNLKREEQPLVAGEKETSPLECAYWKIGDTVSDKIFSLLNLGDSGSGKWANESGESVKIVG